MVFGLLTGTISHSGGIHSGTRYKGGVVRHHIDEFNKVVKADGTIVRPGLIDTIDVFEITGISSARSYGDGSQAGNPLGEMVWEAVRYLGGFNEKLSPTSEYGATGTETKVTPVYGTTANYTLPKLTSWTGRPVLSGSASECPKPVILAISEVIPDHDGDDYPPARLNDFKDVPISSFADVSIQPLPTGAFNIAEYLEIITKTEELSTADSKNGDLFFYPSGRGLCTARELSGLSAVVGHCPSEPSLEGTYNLAAVAYYAHTHDFGSLGGPDKEPSNIDFYAVGIPGNFPDITLTVSDKRSVTLMPMALTAPLDASSGRTEWESDPAFRTLLNFFIEYWQTDDGHQYTDPETNVTKTRKVPYKVKFRTNFEFTMYPCFVQGGNSNNWERDLFNAITISLLTDHTTDYRYREGEPLYINSGPFKTRDRALYLNHRTAYRNAVASNGGDPEGINPDLYFIPTSQPYYYAFKRPKGEAMDISSMKVVGLTVHSDSTGSGYGASGQTGYTITGVTFPGAYLDVGLNRSDYPIYYSTGSGSSCRPSMSVFVPNTACGDEAVPLDPSGSGLPGAQFDYSNSSNISNLNTYGRHGASTPSGFNNHRSGSTVYTNNADCGYYHPPTMWDELLTPAECPYTGYNSSDNWTDTDLIAAYNPKPNHTDVCGKFAAGYKMSGAVKTYPSATSDEGYLFSTSKMRYVQVRSFKFDDTSNRPVTLPNPMWLAAKYGGFKYVDSLTGKPKGWERTGGGVGAADPYNYFGVANMSELPEQLGKAFEAIANSVATGTANASSVSMVLGGGVSVQTQYRTEYKTNEKGPGETEAVEAATKWGGSVYALFMDKWGNLRADSNGNGKLDLATSPPRPGDAGGKEWTYFKPGQTPPSGSENYEREGDLIVHQVPSATEGSTSLSTVYLCRDVYGDNNGGIFLPAGRGDYFGSVTYPPYADCKEQDGGLDSLQPLWNAAQKISDMNVDDRKLFTYYGVDGEGVLKNEDINEILDNADKDWDFKSDKVTGDTHLLHVLMGQDSVEETKNLIKYIRGTDFPGKYRNRTVRLPWDEGGTERKVWRMGDVINSRPVLVGEPNSNFWLTYKDESYEKYRANKAQRRQMAYFGSNDGILHAVNLGFFGALGDGQASYSEEDPLGVAAEYALGAELWGYLPPSVLPHLQWVANEAYQHSYYVDLKPYIVDVKDNRNSTINEEDKWRTIMIVGLRLGGAPLKLPKGTAKVPYTTSEFFALDVTDPEDSPKLLWRFSDPLLGQSTAMPTVVRSGAGLDNKWYIVLPSGPVQTDTTGAIAFDNASELYAGRSTEQARVFILDAMTGKPARDDSNPLIVPEERSFFNDTYVPRAFTANVDKSAGIWSHHAVYLGLAARDTTTDYDSGALYRLQMVDENTGAPLAVNNWKLKRLYKTDKPVTAAANVSYDQVGNYWVLFGTGRIWGPDDMTPCVKHNRVSSCLECYDQYVFGIKEPLNANGHLTFAEVAKDDNIVDVSGVVVYENGDLDPPVEGYGSYEDLYTHMRAKSGDVPVVNGYKLKLELWKRDARNYDAATMTYNKPRQQVDVFELINTQIKLDDLTNKRLNAVVTVYDPSGDICNPLGKSYLTVFDAFVGLPAPYMGSYIGEFMVGISKTDGSGKTVNQVTATVQSGVGLASEAVVIKADGATIYRNIDFVGQNWDIRIPAEQSSGSGFISWREVLDMNFDLKEDSDLMYKDLK